MIRVLLVDDQALLRMGFRLILETEPDIEVAGEAADGAAGVAMASALRPDVVLMDVRMPGLDGIAATAAITAAGPDSKVIILTTFDLDEYVFAGLKAGASGFLLKDAPPADLERIRAAILERRLDVAIIGKLASGKPETYQEAFQRFYGEPLIQPRRAQHDHETIR